MTDLADLRQSKPKPKSVMEKLRTNPIYITGSSKDTTWKYQVLLKLEAKKKIKIRIRENV